MPVGYMDFNPLISANRSALAEGDITANRLAALGQQVGQSIAIQNYKQQAQEMAPLISQAYGQGVNAISQGDIAGGLQHIYSTSAQVMANPLLAPMAHQANQEAGAMATQYMGLEKSRVIQEAIANRERDHQDDVNNRNDERIDATAYNAYAKERQTWEQQNQAYQQNPELFNGQPPPEPPKPAFMSKRFNDAYGSAAAQGTPQKPTQTPQQHFDEIRKNPTSAPDPNVLTQSQNNAQQIAQSGVPTKTFDLGGEVSNLIGGDISFPNPQGKSISRTGNSKTGEIHTTITEKDLTGENAKLKAVYEPAVKAASELSTNTDLVKFIKGKDGNGNIIDSQIGVQGVTLDDNGKIKGKTPKKGNYSGYIVYKILPNGEKEYYTGFDSKGYTPVKTNKIGKKEVEADPIVLDKDQVSPISILKSLPSTAVALGGSLKRRGGSNAQQPDAAQPAAQQGASAAQSAPEGTVVQNSQGQKFVKKNGKFVPMQ